MSIFDKDHVSIPEARAILSRWGMEWNRPELMALAGKLVRRRPKYPVARAKRGSLTPELAARIRDYKNENPSTSNRDIGERFGVDGGRVSEAIHKVKY
jgi:hypothetical protein